MARDFEDHCWKDIVDEEILEIYEPYRRELRVGRKPAVLAIDLYNKAYQGGDRPVREVNRRYSGSCGEHAWKALEPTRALLAAARKAGLPVIYTTRHADTDGVRSTHRKMGSETEELYHIKAELAPEPGELVVYKERASGFFGTPLIAHLRKVGAESLKTRLRRRIIHDVQRLGVQPVQVRRVGARQSRVRRRCLLACGREASTPRRSTLFFS